MRQDVKEKNEWAMNKNVHFIISIENKKQKKMIKNLLILCLISSFYCILYVNEDKKNGF